MNPDDLLQPTIYVVECLGYKRIMIAWPDPEHKPRSVRITPDLLEEIVYQLNDLRARACAEDEGDDDDDDEG